MALAGGYLAESGDTIGLRIMREALDLHQNAETLLAYAKAALALYDLDALEDAQARAIAMGDDTDLAAFLDGVRSGPLRLAAIARALSNKKALRDGPLPVPGRLMYVLHKSLPHANDGYATRSHGLAQALFLEGADLVCVTRPGFPDQTPPGAPIAEIETVDGVAYNRLLTPARIDYPIRPTDHMTYASPDYLEAAAERIGAAIREHRPSCVVAASNHMTALPACLAAHAAGLPFVFEIRGFWEISRASRDPAYLLSTTGRQERYLETATACAAEAVLTLTAPMQKELENRGVAPGKIHIVPNGCDPGAFLPSAPDAALRNMHGLPPDVPVIGYVGSFSQYEGLDNLLRACAALRDAGTAFRLVLVGDEPPVATTARNRPERIRDMARRLGLSDWLLMPGRVPHDVASAWYSLIDIAAFPRKSQPVTELVSPLKPLEALSMEKAVIVSSVAGMQGLVDDERTGLIVKKDDVGALTDALSRLATDVRLRHRLGQAGRTWVEDQRSWRKVARKFLDAVSPLLHG
ncbi:glycosyltransferase family 4 protein [Nioella sp.]|uniref:glycosyltransferase family 4 protein n=1 Tax=Nioella sp. TaxID=1912091 RepID=UPI003A867BD4